MTIFICILNHLTYHRRTAIVTEPMQRADCICSDTCGCGFGGEMAACPKVAFPSGVDSTKKATAATGPPIYIGHVYGRAMWRPLVQALLRRIHHSSIKAMMATARYSGRLLWSPVSTPSRMVRVTSRLMICVPSASVTTQRNRQPSHFSSMSFRLRVGSVKPFRSTHFPVFGLKTCHW